MSYAKKVGSATLYQGTSFTISLGKDDGTEWESNESGVFIVTDSENTEVLNKPMVKSTDNLTLTFQIGKTDCADWDGNYKLIAYQTDSNDPEVFVPIADYDIIYGTTIAGE